jgi:hypothetical protein
MLGKMKLIRAQVQKFKYWQAFLLMQNVILLSKSIAKQCKGVKLGKAIITIQHIIIFKDNS